MIFEVNHDHFSLYGNYIARFRSRSTNQKLISNYSHSIIVGTM